MGSPSQIYTIQSPEQCLKYPFLPCPSETIPSTLNQSNAGLWAEQYGHDQSGQPPENSTDSGQLSPELLLQLLLAPKMLMENKQVKQKSFMSFTVMSMLRREGMWDSRRKHEVCGCTCSCRYPFPGDRQGWQPIAWAGNQWSSQWWSSSSRCSGHLLPTTPDVKCQMQMHRERKVPNLSPRVSRWLLVNWFYCLASGQSVSLCGTSLLGIRVLEVKGKGLSEDHTPAVLLWNWPEQSTYTRVTGKSVLSFYSRLQSAFKQYLVTQAGEKWCIF